MDKQYLQLNIESDLFKKLKNDFNNLLQILLEKMTNSEIEDGSIDIKLKIALVESVSAGEKVCVPLFAHKVKANYTQVMENKGAISLPNMILEYNEELGEFVVCAAPTPEQDMFAEEQKSQTASPLMIADPLCNDCLNQNSDRCNECIDNSCWEPKK